MALFQTSVLNNYLKRQDGEAVTKAYKKFVKYFYNPVTQQNIREIKEEGFQQKFLMELFVNVFGYVINPDPNYNLTTEHKNEKGARKADGAILKNGCALGVIELKSTKTKELESIRLQAFDYKANQTGCVYVVTSNFEKLRFYINNAVDFEEFDLFVLTEKQFALMYLCLHKENLLSDIPLEIKNASVREEEVITKKFYADYSIFKRELYRDLVKLNMKNEVFRTEFSKEDTERANKNIKHNLFKKSQKLIDRFLFIFFAEDRDLLPPNSSIKILEQWNNLKDLDAYSALYARYKLYFNYLDTGRKGTDKTAEIFAYNGGLFKPDAVLDSLLISDELLYKHTKALSNYDFESQVDVNILGHIFENSLNEIESVNAEIEGVEFDKQKTKRKKDGVFYTPKFITKYIVDNTVGKLCEKKKKELGLDIIDINKEYVLKERRTIGKEKIVETGKGTVTTIEKFKTNLSVEGEKLVNKIESYRNWLLKITICDPACGSGAFLNQALNFLIVEHKGIDELLNKVQGKSMVFPDIENTVLENNIFGVDLNEESVEIAKLSLWLRTAQPRRKLNDLNNNIKCGNSLIDSKAVAGDKAFNWQEQFPNVFAKGGFDVVIGNPPYVRAELLSFDDKIFFEKNYHSPFKQYDIYVLFYEKGVNILKNDGILGFITPNKFYIADYGKKIREYILKNTKIEKIIDVSMMNIFPEASVYPTILIYTKSKIINKNIIVQSKVENINQLEFDINTTISQEKFLGSDEYVISTNISNFKLLDKINKKGEPLGNLFKMTRGFRPPKAGLIREIIEDGVYPYLIGEALSKPYNVKWNGKCVQYLPKEIPESNPIEVLIQPKVMIRDIGLNFNAYMDEGHFFCLKTIYFIYGGEIESLRFLTCLLNSKLMNFYFKECFSSMHISGGYLRFRKQFVEKMPIKIDINKTPIFSSFCESQIELNKVNQSIINKFTNYLKSQFKIEKPTNKLQNWYRLSFADFIKELNNTLKIAKGTSLTKLQEMEWMEVFETKKAEVQTLKVEIEKNDKKIDQMVYELYGVTEEEIKIVEGS